MGDIGLGDSNEDQQQQVMIKNVPHPQRPWLSRELITSDLTDASGHGELSCQDSDCRWYGFCSGWRFWPVHVKCTKSSLSLLKSRLT